MTETQRNFRRDLVETLSRELLGPFGGPEEALPQRPTGRYLLGRLAPVGTTVSPEEDETEGAGNTGGDDDTSDSGYASPISMAMSPSSIGISFTVDIGIAAVEATAEWGTYTETAHEVEQGDGTTRNRKMWCREQHSRFSAIAITDSGRQLVDEGVEIQWLCRTLPDGRRRAVSMFLVNRAIPASPSRTNDNEWLFQPRLRVRGLDGAAVFQSRSLDDVVDFEMLDPDRRADELLFRHRPEYAVGHGCAAEWVAQGGDGATELATAMLPTHELARTDPRRGDANGLDMRLLGGADGEGVSSEQLEASLAPLADAYGAWVEGLASQVVDLDERLRAQGRRHLEECRAVHRRISEGIQLLSRTGDELSDLARQAFCFANRAMALQRSRSEAALRRRQGERVANPDDIAAEWRPFQLAFILMNLPPLVDRTHSDRETCDLLWFPTGGGKTEAYLGLTAFVLALRRIRPSVEGHRSEGGVGVLMRYTLRLLTTQQFQRATTLACACEFLRQCEGCWGDEPFSVGIWVGNRATPNYYSATGNWGSDGAKQALEKWAEGSYVRGGTPAQLLNCPWCGAPLGPDDYEADDAAERVRVFCSSRRCDFARRRGSSDGIPVHTVDEQIYRHVPSLIIATVDKFAQMAWNGRVQSLFGGVQRYCERHGYICSGEAHAGYHRAAAKQGWPRTDVVDVEPFEPPDLIIQDELHLISGPLGTLVGLYETAVDALASIEVQGQRYPAKVVASTATIRRAEEQVRSLFCRSLTVFPPAGLDSADSWFGMETSLAHEPGRMYLGIFAPGKSVKTALVRVYAALLSRAKKLHELDPEAADTYMTLVGYFNSLRELGGTVRLAEDDIPGRIDVLSKRSRDDFAFRDLYERPELTSNRTAEEVPQVLSWLERQFPAGKPQTGRYPVDVLFASNMISVGVDIDRLGLMVVDGQPKTTAEYIQATSRVGRRTPGLVVTVYNWTRPRDISHYERFRSYHAALYRHVEPTSVTPFSSRARDKGLAGVLASLVRQGDPDMAPEQGARNFDPDDDWVREVIEVMCERAAQLVDPAEGLITREEVLGLVETWDGLDVASGLPWSRSGISSSGDPEAHWLLDPQEDEQQSGDRRGTFVAPNSLREIESEVPVYLLGITEDAQ